MTFYNKDIRSGKNKRLNNSITAADITDENLSDRIITFTEVLRTTTNKKGHKTPIKFLISLSHVNFPIKFNTKSLFILEADMDRLFEYSGCCHNCSRRGNCMA